MTNKSNPSISLGNPNPEGMNKGQQWGLAIFSIGLLFLLVAWTGASNYAPWMFFFLSIGLGTGGGLLYIYSFYKGESAGVKNDHTWHRSLTSRGSAGWMLGIVLTGFYVLIYWFPGTLDGMVRAMDPLSYMISGQKADQWFLYGTIYTLGILVMGVKAILKYRHSNYQIIRTASVMFFQLAFAFLIPNILQAFQQPGFYFSYFWPLEHKYLFPSTVGSLTDSGTLGVFMVFWGAAMTFIVTPILTYFYGKRWYCSWVCGCGGLANTVGDPWRHLSDKSLAAWKFERWSIHLVLVFVVVVTSLLWIDDVYKGSFFGAFSDDFRWTYGFFIGTIWQGVVGVGFYPLMGTRVWCRFGCPMAAILGLQQKFFSRFRITTNGGQCISCGNCSTYCEMGIDVKWYAQRGQNIVRASCVGCGMCATVCPRGVLNLENGPAGSKVSSEPIMVGNESIELNPNVKG